MLGKDVYEKISPEELVMIKDYISSYADIDACGKQGSCERAPLRTILAPWAAAKNEYLYQLMGGELILSKDITFNMSHEELCNKCDAVIYGYDKDIEERDEDPAYVFFKKFREKLVFLDLVSHSKEEAIWRTEAGFDNKIANKLRALTSTDTLVNNIYNDETFEIPNPKTGKPFRIQKGCKAVKTIVKIANMYDIPGAEEFRIAHSQVVNQKVIKGKLCLSIHPLDYMTMSDNGCGWESCMSWENSGAYRQGTVEMMNSPCVVVAYIAASEDMEMPRNTFHWNSKKWRELFVVNRDIITNVKGYPYINPDISAKVVDWLRELATKNVGFTYHDKAYNWHHFVIETEYSTIEVFPKTGIMYNDFDYSEPHVSYLGSHINLKDDYVEFYYSGVSECMWCGGTDLYINCENQLMCDQCESWAICDVCGERIDSYEYENNYHNGLHVCNYCLEERFLSNITGKDVIFDEAAIELAFKVDNYVFTSVGAYMNLEEETYKDIINCIGSHEGAELKKATFEITDYWGFAFDETLIFIDIDDIIPSKFENCTGDPYEYFKEVKTVNGYEITDEWKIETLAIKETN